MIYFDLNIPEVEHFENHKLYFIKDLSPPYDYLVEDEEFFMMTVFLMRILHTLFDWRKAENVQVLLVPKSF